MGKEVTLTFERPLIKEINLHIFELFCVCDGRHCITSAWEVLIGLFKVVCWKICMMGMIGWRLDGGFELWCKSVL